MCSGLGAALRSRCGHGVGLRCSACGQKAGALGLRKACGSPADHIEQPEGGDILLPDGTQPAAPAGAEDQHPVMLPLGTPGGKLGPDDLPGGLRPRQGQPERVGRTPGG